MDEYETKITELRNINASAAQYLARIDQCLWVTAYLTGKSYGHKTSNVVESMNSVLKSERGLSILELLNEIWHITIEERFQRYQKACKTAQQQIHIDFCLSALVKSRQWAAKNTVRMSTATIGIVEQVNDRSYEVSLEERTCDCGRFQESGIPCGHVFSCMWELGKSLRDFVPEEFTIQTWKNTYLSNLAPLSLGKISLLVLESANPISQAHCLLPAEEQTPKGQPQVVRLTASSQRKKTARTGSAQ